MSIVDQIMRESPTKRQQRTAESARWFRERVASLSASSIHEASLLTPSRFVSRPLPGQCFMFFYDPKLKKTLPYYDRFPLVFLVDVDRTGFTGLNVHYLDPISRAKLIDALHELTTNKRYDENTRLRMTYALLQSSSKYRYFKPCLKRYLWAHTRSRLAIVHSDEWDLVAAMPLQRFVGAQTQRVWTESRKIFGG